jgi:hypothetical protein
LLNEEDKEMSLDFYNKLPDELLVCFYEEVKQNFENDVMAERNASTL